MINIKASETLILSSTVLAFTHVHLAIIALSLGVLGAIIRYTIDYGEKQQKAKEVESTTENISKIVSGLASNFGNSDRSNVH